MGVPKGRNGGGINSTNLLKYDPRDLPKNVIKLLKTSVSPHLQEIERHVPKFLRLRPLITPLRESWTRLFFLSLYSCNSQRILIVIVLIIIITIIFWKILTISIHTIKFSVAVTGVIIIVTVYSPSLDSSPPPTPKFDKNYHPFPFINTPLNRKISFGYEYEIWKHTFKFSNATI